MGRAAVAVIGRWRRLAVVDLAPVVGVMTRRSSSARVWRGLSAFRGRSWWLWAAVAVIVGGEGVISGWNLGTASYNQYYVDAARSMSLNTHALLFGAFDPGASITLDKLSGFLVPQVLSIWVFGFHPWSTLLPQVLEGMVTVLAGYVIGARWKGPAAGLVAAAAVATTPLLVSMFGRSSEDAMITMCLALAFWCWQSALLSGRLLPLIGGCVWVAVGFQAKMMQAWFIIPALGVAYLLAAPHPLAQRIRRALLAGAVTLVLSLAWVTFIQLTPASDRPYIDGTTDNNVFTMVFGYNGFNRLIPNLIPGVVGNTATDVPAVAEVDLLLGRTDTAVAPSLGPGEPPPVTSAVKPSTGTATHVPRTMTATSLDPAVRTAKLLLPRYTTQVGWLYPLAAAGAALTLWPVVTGHRRRRRRRRSSAVDPVCGSDVTGSLEVMPSELRAGTGHGLAVGTEAQTRRPSIGALPAPAESRPAPQVRPPLNASSGTAVAMLGWLIIDAAFLSAAVIPHATYLAAISVQLAVLCGVALVQAVRWCRILGWPRFVLPALLAGQVIWTLRVLHTSGVAPAYLTPTVAVLGAAVITAAVLCGVSRKFARRPQLAGPILRRSAAAGAAVVVLIAPAVWSIFNITVEAGGYGDAYGGPLQVGRNAGHPALSSGGQPFHVRSPLTRTEDPHLNPAQQHLVDYLRSEVGTGTLMAVDSWRQAEPYILDTGSAVIPMGGFRGLIDTPTMMQLHVDIARGRLRFFLLHDLATKGSRGSGPTSNRNSIGTEAAHIGQLRTWITGHCRLVTESTYEPRDLHLPAQKLYTCPAAAARADSPSP